MPTFNSPHDLFSAKTRRILALLKKETRQIIRDPSSIAVGIGLPIVLILLFGYGPSLDVKDIPIAIVLEDPSTDAAEIASAFQLSPYFHSQLVASMVRAQELILAHRVDGIVRIRPDFSRQLRSRRGEVQTCYTAVTPIAQGSFRHTRKRRLVSGLNAKSRRAEKWSAAP
jgi:ABC-2 type transport system permease protein